MKINKITYGFVTQVFDTEKKAFVSQSFEAGSQVDYENELGESMDPEVMEEYNFGPYAKQEPYLPFDMVSPEASVNLRSCQEQIQQDLLAFLDNLPVSGKDQINIQNGVCEVVLNNFKKYNLL